MGRAVSILGLTGNLASGKSTVLKLLRKKGALIFDADKRIHRYYKQKRGPVYKKIAVMFPQVIKGGQIQRKKLADIVFSDKSALKKLEAIIHPLIIKDMLRWEAKRKDKRRVYIAEVPLLFEKKLDHYFKAIILVITKRQILIPRIIKKYHLSKNQVLKRLSLYTPLKEKIKRADFVINNNSGFKKLEKEVDLLWKKLKEI